MNGKKNGRGRLITEESVYNGEWKDDKLHGFGLNQYRTLDKYEGFHYMGQFHAYGKFQCPDGESYEGEFHHGKQQGHAISTWPNGNIYEGPFKNGMKHGIAVIKEPGRQRKSEWREDEFVRWIESSNALD